MLLLLVFISSFVYAQDTLNLNEDRQVVGVIKVYLTRDDKYITQVSFADTTVLKYGGFTLYDIIIRSYFDTYPLLYPDLTIESLRQNINRFKEEYYPNLPK